MRETRHLWVGNLPDNVREERVLEHFERYGKVEKIKLLEKQGSVCSACIAFVDIKSALKAMNSINTINEQILKTDFFDPTTTSKSPHQTDGQQRFQQSSAGKMNRPRKHAGNTASTDDKVETKDRTIDKSPDENSQDNSPNVSHSEKYRSKKHRDVAVKKKSKKKLNDLTKPKKDKTIGHSPNKPKKEDSHTGIDKKSTAEEEISLSSRSGSTRSSSRSRSVRSSSTSSISSTSSTNSTASTGSISSSATADGSKKKVVAMCIRKLSTRPTVSSLRDGIFHEFKRYGKVRSVLIKGEGADRYALVIFRNTSDANKAITHAKTKLLFGAAIEASIFEGEVNGQELEECGGIIDEFHPRASRTLFVGNLDKTVGYSDIQNIFVRFGHIVAIEIKKQNSIPQYAFLQYSDISSVVRAISKMDGEKLGRNPLKLGFGKTVISSCLWVSGVTDSFTENYLASCFQRYGSVKQVVIDRNRGMALVFYSQFEHAQLAMSEMKSRILNRSRLKMDFASNELIDLFIKSMQKSGQSIPNLESIRHLMLPSNSPGILSSSTGNPPSLVTTPNHHYSRGPQSTESGRSYYDDYPHQNYADSPSGSYSESSSRRGSYSRPWQGRERSRDRYSGYPPDPLHRRRPYDDPPYDRPDREYYRSGDHPPPSWEHDNYSESRSKGHPPHYDQDYRHQDYDARRDHDRMYGRYPIGPSYDDPYYNKRERGRDMERSKDRMRDRDRERDAYYSRSSHASPSLRHVHRSRSQSPSSSRGKSRELDRTSIEKNFLDTNDPNYRKCSSRGISPDAQIKKRKPSGESRSSTTSSSKLPTQDVDMRENTLSRSDRRSEYRGEKRKGHVKSQRSPENSRDHRSEYKLQRKNNNYDMDMRKSGSLKDNDSEGSPYYQQYPQSRSRSETPTRDENPNMIGEIIIKQSLSKTRYDESVSSPSKPIKREHERREEGGGDKDYRTDYSSLNKDYLDTKNSDKSRTFAKDLDYRKGVSKTKSLNSPLHKRDRSHGDENIPKEKFKSKHCSPPLLVESNLNDVDVQMKKAAKKRRISVEEKEHLRKKERRVSESKVAAKHEAPMSVAQQIFMQGDEGSDGTQSPNVVPDQPMKNKVKCKNSKKEEEESAKSVTTLDITGYDAMFLPNKRLLPVKAAAPIKTKPPDKPSEEMTSTPQKSQANVQNSAGNLVQLEKEKLRLQKLLSKLDSDSLDKDEAGEIANVVLDKIVQSSKEKRAKKEAKSKSTTVSPVAHIKTETVDEEVFAQNEEEKIEEIVEDSSYEVEEVEMTSVEIPTMTESVLSDALTLEDESKNAVCSEEILSNNLKDEILNISNTSPLVSPTKESTTIEESEKYNKEIEAALPKEIKSEPLAKSDGSNTSEIKSDLTPTRGADKDCTKIKSVITSSNNTPVVSTVTNQAPLKSVGSTTTPSPLSSSSTSSSKSFNKVPYIVPPKQPEHHLQQRKAPHKKTLISPSSKHHAEHYRLKHHHNDSKKRRPSSSSQHKKPTPQSTKKPPYKASAVPYVEKSVKITVGIDKSPNKPLTKKELDRLRVELENLKRHLSLDSEETNSPVPIEEKCSPMSSTSPLLYSPIDTKENMVFKRSDSNQSSNFMVPSNTDRLKQFGRIKKKTKPEDVAGNNTSANQDKKEMYRVKQELHNQRACDFRESRLLRSCIFEQDLERLELLQQEMETDDVKVMLNCWSINGTADTLLFTDSRFLEPLPDNIINGELPPTIASMETTVNAPTDVNPMTGQNSFPTTQSLTEDGPKNVCSLSISDLPASAESQNTNVGGKNFSDLTSSDELNHNDVDAAAQKEATLQENLESGKMIATDIAIPTSADNTVTPSPKGDKDSVEIADKIFQNDQEKSSDILNSTDTCDHRDGDHVEESNVTSTKENRPLISNEIINEPSCNFIHDDVTKNTSDLSVNENEVTKKDVTVQSFEQEAIIEQEIMEMDVVEPNEVLIESSENILEVDDEFEAVSEEIASEVVVKEQVIVETVSSENFVEEVVIPCEESEEKILKPQPKKNMIIDDDDEDDLYDNKDDISNEELTTTEKAPNQNYENPTPATEGIVEKEVTKIFLPTISSDSKTSENPKHKEAVEHAVTTDKSANAEYENEEKHSKIKKESTLKDVEKSSKIKVKKDKKKKIKSDISKHKHLEKSSSLSGKVKNKEKSHKKEKHKDNKVSKPVSKSDKPDSSISESVVLEKTPKPQESKSLAKSDASNKPPSKGVTSEAKAGKSSDHKSTVGSAVKLKKKKRKHGVDNQEISKAKDLVSSKQKNESSQKTTDIKTTNIKKIIDDKSKLKKEKSKLLSNKSESLKKEKIIKKNLNKDSNVVQLSRLDKKPKHSTSLKTESKKSERHKSIKATATHSVPEPESKKQKLSPSRTKEHKKLIKSTTNVLDKKSKYALVYSDSESSDNNNDTADKTKADPNLEKRKFNWSDYKEMEMKDNEMKKKAVHLSSSSSSSNSSEFNDGPPPVPPSSMIVTETLKNETILPPEYNQPQLMPRLKETSSEQDTSSSSKSQKKITNTKLNKISSPKKQKEVQSKAKFMPSSSSEFSDSDESDLTSLQQIPLKKVDNISQQKQSLKSSLFSPSESSSELSDSDDLSEIPLKNSPKKSKIPKPTTKDFSDAKAKSDMDRAMQKSHAKSSSHSSDPQKAKLGGKEKVKIKGKLSKPSRPLVECSNVAEKGTAAFEKKKKHKHVRKDEKSAAKLDEKHFKSEHKTEADDIAEEESKSGVNTSSLKHSKDRVKIHKNKQSPNNPVHSNSQHEKLKKNKSNHYLGNKGEKNESKKMMKKKQQNPFMQHLKESTLDTKPNVSQGPSSVKPKSMFSDSEDEKEVYKRKASKPFEGWKNFENMSKLKSDTDTMHKPSKQAANIEQDSIKDHKKFAQKNYSQKIEDKTNVDQNFIDNELKKDLTAKQSPSFYGHEPGTGKLNIVESPESFVETTEPLKVSKQEKNIHVRNFTENISKGTIAREEKNVAKSTLSHHKEKTMGHKERAHIGEKANIVQKTGFGSHDEKSKVHHREKMAKEKPHSHMKTAVLQAEKTASQKRKMESHSKEKKEAKPHAKIKSNNRSQDEEAVLSIVGFNEDFKSSSSDVPSDEYLPNKKEPRKEIKSCEKVNKVGNKSDFTENRQDDSLSAADRELAAAVSSIEFGFGDFQRTKTPTVDDYSTNSYQPPTITKQLSVRDNKAESSAGDESQMSQEEIDSSEAAVAANALLKFSADEDSSFEIETRKTGQKVVGDQQVVKEKSPKYSEVHDAILMPSVVKPTYNKTGENSQVQNFKESVAAKHQVNANSRKRRRQSKDEHSGNPKGNVEHESKPQQKDHLQQNAKQPRVDVSIHQEIVSAKQGTSPQIVHTQNLPESPVRSTPTTWSPFIQSKYSPSFVSKSHTSKQPVQQKVTVESDITETVRRPSNDQDQNEFIHPKIPNIHRRKSSSSSPAMSPNAGRGMPTPATSFEQITEKTGKQISPNLVHSSANISPRNIQRYEFPNPIAVSPSQQYQGQMPFLPKPANFSPRGALSQPPPTTSSPGYQIAKALPVSSVPVVSYAVSNQNQLSPRLTPAQKFTSPPHVVSSQPFPLQPSSAALASHGQVHNSPQPNLQSSALKINIAEQSASPSRITHAQTTLHSVVTSHPHQAIPHYAFSQHPNAPPHPVKAPLHQMVQPFPIGMQFVNHPAHPVEKSPNNTLQSKDALPHARMVSPHRNNSIAQSPVPQNPHVNQTPIRSPHQTQSKPPLQQQSDKLPPHIQYSLAPTMMSPHGAAMHSPRQPHGLGIQQPTLDLLQVYHPNYQQQIQQQQAVATARNMHSHRPQHSSSINGPMYSAQLAQHASANSQNQSNIQKPGVMNNSSVIKPPHSSYMQKTPPTHRIVSDPSKLVTTQSTVISTAPQVVASTKASSNTSQKAVNPTFPPHAAIGNFPFPFPLPYAIPGGHESMLQYSQTAARHSLPQGMIPYPYSHPAFRMPQNLALASAGLISGNPPITTDSQNISSQVTTGATDREKNTTPLAHHTSQVKNQPQQFTAERIVKQPSGVNDLISQHFHDSLKDIPSAQGPPQQPQAPLAESPKFHPHQPTTPNAYNSPHHQPSYIHPQHGLVQPPNIGQPYYHPPWPAGQQPPPQNQPTTAQKQPQFVPPPETRKVAKEFPHPGPTETPKTQEQEDSSVGVMGLFQRYPVIWQGMLMLKNDSAKVQTHYICGNRQLGEFVLPKAHDSVDGNLATLKINQRMRLEPSQLEGVSSRLNGSTAEFCLLLALPCGSNQTDVTTQQNLLRQSFVEYLQQKQAAGIVNMQLKDNHAPGSYVVQIFPPCEFTDQNLRNRAQDFLSNINDIQHLMIVISPA